MAVPLPPPLNRLRAQVGAAIPSWEEVLERAGRVADEADHLNRVGARPEDGPPPPGMTASAWAVLKASATVMGGPVSLPAMVLAGRRAQRTALARIDRFDEHLQAVAEGRRSPLPAPRRSRLSSDRRIVITSDLHRCVPGRLDWPARQRTKDLSLRVMSHYAEQGWDLIENGDVEDFWLVGGSTWGAMYDVGRIAGGVGGRAADAPRRGLMAEHLDRIVDNNAALYRLLDEGFAADGRYHRTMGNHDDVYEDEQMVQHLRRHLPGTEVVDTVLLTAPERVTSRPGATGPRWGDREGLAAVDAVVAHGHLTDAWNGPGTALLGRIITWTATAFDDLPGLNGATNPLPDEEAVGRLLTGRARNRLITLDPRIGGNRRFDSLDEERLFSHLAAVATARGEAIGAVRPDGSVGWPWLLFDHTHLPMLSPLDATGSPVRYANSGTSLLDHALTSIEWDPARREPRLVVWTDEPDGPRRRELIADGAHLAVLDDA
ncbi:MAG TPA: hypothetical protein P5193_02030 [Microthrixaceae bacterium]|nr:hypothetical protein [Microthrixaceae bacterium]MCB9375917.1 hypothetical protein [Microthrixaceae bacterium]MCO5305606.1 hypothetical protein [Microthrixaceae bacterium]RTL09408.1 MAG: hypothetical protein EKK62_02365 [Acidimicrobiia bacterium]HRW40302.1 hypothetical protein [Microthrixaceae bacterium]